jgi:hypothetical protein
MGLMTYPAASSPENRPSLSQKSSSSEVSVMMSFGFGDHSFSEASRTALERFAFANPNLA